MGVLAVLVLLAVPLTGGRLSRLGNVSFRLPGLLPLALGLQVLVINVIPTAPAAFVVPVHLATYVLATVFVWVNRRIPGLAVVALGGAMNGITIAVNGGTLPASAEALRRAGLEPDPDQFTNSAVLAQPELAWLGDVYAIPDGVPLANVFSLGDVVILVGLVFAVHRLTRVPRPVPASVPLTFSVAELGQELALARAAAEAAHARQRVLPFQPSALLTLTLDRPPPSLVQRELPLGVGPVPPWPVRVAACPGARSRPRGA